MGLLAGKKLLEVFDVVGLRRYTQLSDSSQRCIQLSSLSKTEKHPLAAQKHGSVSCLYLLLSFILPKGIPPLHEIRQTQEVNHLSFPIDQSTKDWGISVKRKKLHCYISLSFIQTCTDWFKCYNLNVHFKLHI